MSTELPVRSYPNKPVADIIVAHAHATYSAPPSRWYAVVYWQIGKIMTVDRQGHGEEAFRASLAQLGSLVGYLSMSGWFRWDGVRSQLNDLVQPNPMDPTTWADTLDRVSGIVKTIDRAVQRSDSSQDRG